MAFLPVVSSALTAVDYDRTKNQLKIKFGEAVYEYTHVPSHIVLDFLFAESIGSTFNTLVKKGGFGFRRLSEDELDD